MTSAVSSDAIAPRAAELLEAHHRDIHERTDRLFAWLMAAQWIAGIVFAVWVSPLTWDGPISRTHIHVWAAVIVGGIISLFPALLGLYRPGLPSTRFTIATAQMLMGALLIHLTGGRIETHFHVFGSLAFLAFYRDWRVLIPATAVVAADHMIRGAFWPQSVYGVLVASQWRWLEHAAWVIFEDVFLLVACRRSIVEMQQTAVRTAALEQEGTERRHAEAALELRNEQLTTLVDQLRVTQRRAEQATRAKSDFLSSMSHELRTPLNAIILYSELLHEEAEDTGNNQSIADLERIRSAGRHLLELVDGVLDLSKIEAGKMTLSLETFDVRATVDELLDTVGSLVEKNANTLTVRYGDGVDAMTADLIKMKQILLNLLSNAGKFTREGVIELIVERGTLNDLETMDFIVTDTGVGMTPEQTSRIFEPFTQADVTTTRKYGGSGLGLALVARFCHLMGGDVFVDSRAGAGSRFTVRLPRVVSEVIPDLPGEADAA